MHKAILKLNRALLRSQNIEQVAHEMASLLGQWIDEGKLANEKELKREANILCNRFEMYVSEGEEG